MKVPNLFAYDIYFNNEKIGNAKAFCKSIIKLSLISSHLWKEGMEIKFVGFNREER